MACNCKRVNKFQEEHGEPQEETTFEKSYRYIYKIMIFAIAILIALVITPTIVMIAVYKMIFKNSETIVLPEFLSKYMR